jgi:hypothetical protein
VHDTGRQRFENMLWQGCAGTWAMPVYPDVFALPAAVSSGATALSIPTAGRDFTVGGTVLLKPMSPLMQPAGWSPLPV